MNFFKNIKKNYELKLIQDFIIKQNFQELNSLFLQKYNNDIKFFKYAFIQHEKYLIESEVDQKLGNKLIWLNSYLSKDVELLVNFLKFYFEKIKFNSVKFINYQNYILDMNAKLEIKEMRFEDYIMNANFYQYCLKNFSSKENFSFIINHIPFYETEDKKMFTNINLSSCYFYIMRHPLEVLTILNREISNIDLSINKLLNLDHSHTEYSSQNNSLLLPLKDWGTHVNSWTSTNVINSFSGYIIDYDELNKDTNFVLSEVIGHLIMKGLPISLNYEIINQYISQNFKIEETPRYQLSNVKKKLFKRNIQENAPDIKYEL